MRSVTNELKHYTEGRESRPATVLHVLDETSELGVAHNVLFVMNSFLQNVFEGHHEGPNGYSCKDYSISLPVPQGSLSIPRCPAIVSSLLGPSSLRKFSLLCPLSSVRSPAESKKIDSRMILLLYYQWRVVIMMLKPTSGFPQLSNCSLRCQGRNLNCN